MNDETKFTIEEIEVEIRKIAKSEEFNTLIKEVIVYGFNFNDETANSS